MKQWIMRNKKMSIVLAIVVALGAYGIVKGVDGKSGETRYVLANAAKGTVVASISGSGQVAASNEVTLSSKVSGTVTEVPVAAGQQVRTGTAIARLDATDALFDLQTAQLSYEKLTTVDGDTLRNAEENYRDAYTNARTTLIESVTDMDDTMADLDGLFQGYLASTHYGLSDSEKTYRKNAESEFFKAEKALKTWKSEQATISTTTDEQKIDALLPNAVSTAEALVQAAKKAQDAVVYLRDRSEDKEKTQADEAYTSVIDIVTKANTTLASLSSAKRAATDAAANLNDIKEGPDELDVRAEQLSLKQKQEALEEHTVRAPFEGIIASVEVRKGDTVSSSTEIATLITKEKIAEISLNEVDAAKVSVGQRATITFDAIDDLSITGSVAEVDMVGTVTQGVVNYAVKVGFDTDDERVKPGMTANAMIITDSRTDTIAIPISAVKTDGETSYVETLEGVNAGDVSPQGISSSEVPTRIEVTTGLASDDSIEILSGLQEGDSYIIRTTKPSTMSTGGGAGGTSTPSILGGGGGNRMFIR